MGSFGAVGPTMLLGVREGRWSAWSLAGVARAWNVERSCPRVGPP